MYKDSFDCKLFYKANLKPCFGKSENNYLEKYNITPDICFKDRQDFVNQCEEIINLLKENTRYKKIASDNFMSSVIDIAAYASSVAFSKRHVSLLYLNFTNLDLEYLINHLLPIYFDINTVKTIKKIYSNIDEVYKTNVLNLKIGNFFNNELSLNQILTDLILRDILAYTKICKYFNVYKNMIILYGNQRKSLENHINNLSTQLGLFNITFRKLEFYDIRYDDVIFANNLIIVNGKGKTLNSNTLNLFRWQIDNNVSQVVKLSQKTENLLLCEMDLFEVNQIKNGYAKYEGEFLKRQNKWITKLREIC